VPTLLELLDRPPEPDCPGRSLVPQLLHPSRPLDRPVFARVDPFGTTANRLRAVVFRGWKLIRDLNAGTHEVYDLRWDPRELKNLAGEGGPEETELTRLLGTVLELECISPSRDQEEELDRLARAYGEPSRPERRRALERAEQTEGPAARRLFRSALRWGGSPEILRAAEWLLERHDPEAGSLLLEQLDAPESPRRAAAALALGHGISTRSPRIASPAMRWSTRSNADLGRTRKEGMVPTRRSGRRPPVASS